jgi:DCN1-like protein 1/2
MDAAMDTYFQAMQVASGGTTTRKPSVTVNTQQLSALFDKYRDPEERDLILVEGTEMLCQDLQVDPTDVVVLVLAWHLKCENMCEFKRDGWIKGWTELGCVSSS